jgi:zinc protease
VNSKPAGLRRLRTPIQFAALGGALALLPPEPLPAAAQTPASAPATTAAAPKKAPLLPFEKSVLDNGLTLILHRDPSLPLVAVNLWYHVGPANESAGRSGFAHLFEHLMYEGSRHAGREFDYLLEAAGATNVNGTTSFDRTNYFETVPREHLELALWLESDRMGYLLDAVDQERLDVQRDVVKNERRQSYDNAPYGPSWLALSDALFPLGHPYHGAIIGSMEDLSRATLNDVHEFFHAYYAPSNATLALAGDFDPAEAKALVRKYFGTLKGEPTTRPRPKPTPPLAKATRVEITEPVELARVMMGWITPPAFSREDVVLDVAMAILAGGKATRLYRDLVVERKLASEVDAGVDSNGLASMALVSGTVASGKSVAELEAGLGAVIDELAKSGPTADELTRAKRRILLQIHGNLELLNSPGGDGGRAGILQRLDHYLGDPGHLDTWLAEVEAVTADDVKRVVTAQLRRDARAVVVTVPRSEAKAPGKAAP